MNSIPTGKWAIESVLINEETVMNYDSVRSLHIQKDEWVLQPVGQRFRVRQSSGNSAILESQGDVYYAEYEVSGSDLLLRLSREKVKETLTIEAIAITADVFVNSQASVS